MSPYQVVRDFEAAVCEYTGAPYCVTVNSCTMAILLALKWYVTREFAQMRSRVCIPRHTYVSVPMSIIHAGGHVSFRDESWLGQYRLDPFPIYDSARRFTSGMYIPGAMQCVSFHASKILGDTQGGAILHNDATTDTWFRRMRFDGRTEGVAPKDDHFVALGYHCYMSADVAARLLVKLYSLPKHNADLPNDDYPDLSTMEIFR